MSKHYLGMSHNCEIEISHTNTNKNVLIVGICGSGKSVRLNEIEEEFLKSDTTATVIAIDINGTRYQTELENCQLIEVVEDGLGLQLFDGFCVDEQDARMKANMIAYVADLLSAGQRFGVRQKAALRAAISFALSGNNLDNWIDDVKAALLLFETRHADSVLDVLEPLFAGEYLKPRMKEIKKGCLNIVSFKGINPSTQKVLIDIFLSILWKRKRSELEKEDGVMLSIDEFQNLNLYRESILSQLLTEARKYHLHLILATQTLARYDKIQLGILNQANAKLFFQPAKSDLSTIARMIDVEKAMYWYKILDNLKVGQAVAIGELYLDNKKRYLNIPIITKSKFGLK